MNLKLTKKGKIVIFVILGLIVLGSGGFLLWRVLQEDTVAPEDSAAKCGGEDEPPCGVAGCYSGHTLKDWGATNDCNGNELTDGGCYCSNNGCWGKSQACRCNPGGCDSDDCRATKACEYPGAAYKDDIDVNTCICVPWYQQKDRASGIAGRYCAADPFCFPPECPSGEVSCGVSGDGEDKTGCTQRGQCESHCVGCGNLSIVYRYCKPEDQPPVNTCEGGSWLDKPTGQYPYGTELNPITVRTTDVDGLGTVTVNVNGNDVPTCGQIVGATCYIKENKDIKIYLSPGQQYIGAGNYSLIVTWKDGKEIGGDNCTLSTSFTILEQEEPDPYCGDGILTEGEQCELGDPTGYSCLWSECNQTTCICPETENPDWNISKTGVGECIVQNQQTYAKGTYTITVTNVGEGEGSIDKIEDQLDSKVLETYINEISNSGIYGSGIITWDLEGEDEIFSPGESLQLTYYILVPKEDFGIYENTVTAYPTEGDNFSDDEDIDLQCDIPEEGEEVPQTGLFDSVLSKIILGIVMIMIGVNWNNIHKLNYTVKEFISDRRIKNFENRVSGK